MTAAILTDLTRCIGCGACTLRCKETNGLRYSEVDNLDAYTWCSISKQQGLYVKRQCMHCAEPTCASVCPVGALHKTALGPVVYDADKCMGCRYCMQACPFQVPAYEWDKRLPKVRKCNMCYERQIKGEPTACTAACPTNATVCGERDSLIAEARKRIAEKPGQYFDRIYGVQEVGGTSVLYLSAVPFEQIGLRTNVPKEALPKLTWQVLELVPDVVSTGSVLLGGVWWITNRRSEVSRKEGHR